MSKFSQGGSAAESGPLASPQGVTPAPPVGGYGVLAGLPAFAVVDIAIVVQYCSVR